MDANGLLSEIDSNFEPHGRTRSNTWPCRPAEDFIEAQNGSPVSDEIGNEQLKDISVIKQKTSSRRNAWGNLSYADLITKAIQSSPEQRLTLSQIYDWMVQNVPYFKDKGDNTSSAGWKNSIRHNLSLHSRFMRVQNEGTGKSSWWVINPDAKPGKAPRRRAGSMETKSFEKKRGRIKKRIEAIRAGQENGSISNEDCQDVHFNSFSPEFRTRAGSNASSGRLSPIQAAVEPDLHDGQVPPMSPIPWGPELDDDYEDSSKSFSLVDSLVGDLNIHKAGTQCLASGSNDVEMDSISNSTIKRQLLSGGSFQFNVQNNYDNFGNLPALPSYNDHIQQQQSSQHTSVLKVDTMSTQSRNYLNMSPNPMYPDNVHQQQKQHQRTMSSPGTSALGINTQHSPVRSPQMSPSHYSPRTYIPSPQPLKLSPQNIVGQSQINHVPMNQGQQPQQQMGSNYIGGRSLLQQCLEAPNDSMLRAALTQHMSTTYQAQPVRAAHTREFGQYNYLNSMTVNNHMLPPAIGHCGPNHQVTHGGHVVSAEGGLSLAEIDTNNMLDLDYDVEQLLRHELEMDANLDFNFESSNVPTSETKQIVR